MNQVCAVIVTYNRKELLIRNVDSILKQTTLADVLIYDNCSSDGTETLIREQNYDPRVIYIRANENTGGAGGFSHGIEEAYGRGYAYIWLMDDDGYSLNENTLGILVRHMEKFPQRKMMLNSLVLCNPSEQGGDDTLSFTLFGERKISAIPEKIVDGEIRGEISSFNSTLFSRKLVEEVGTVKAEFFIYGDDTEYLKRAQLAGYELITVVESRYYHPDSGMGYRRIFGKIVAMREQTLRNTYYYVRNYMYIIRNYSGKKKALIHGIKVILKTFLYKKEKFRKLRVSWYGLIDGYRGEFGRQRW